MIPVASAPTKHGPDVRVDGFHDAKGDLHVAIGQDAIQVGQDELGELLEGREPLAHRSARSQVVRKRRAFASYV